MTEKRIDLNDYRVIDANKNLKSRVFAGRPRGEDVRKRSGIDTIISECDKLIIFVPSDIRAINPSFFEEFLFNSVRKLGPAGFQKKVEFQSDGGFKFAKPLQEAIREIMRRSSAIE